MTIRILIQQKVFPAWADAPARAVFDQFSLILEEGEVCALVGPSGIGKSSLLHIVAGLDRDFAGSVEGRPRRIGYLFQSPRLLSWRTVRQNLELIIPHHPEKADAWLAQVGLSEAGDVYPQRLSLGMARRVSLARALAVGPQLLLLDEPFSALDEATAKDMQNLVATQLKKLRATTLLVTHHWHEAAALADRVVTLDGSPARIVDDRPIRSPRAAE